MYAYNVNSAKCDGQAMLEIKIGSLSGPGCELEREEGATPRCRGGRKGEGSFQTLKGASYSSSSSFWAGLVWFAS